jgi:hypothetical protein
MKDANYWIEKLAAPRTAGLTNLRESGGALRNSRLSVNGGLLYLNTECIIIISVIRKGGQGIRYGGQRRRSDNTGSRSGWTGRRAGDSGVYPDEKFEE